MLFSYTRSDFHENKINIIGNGVVIDPVIFKEEIEKLKELNVDLSNKLLISRKAHLILPTHRLIDKASELSKGKKKNWLYTQRHWSYIYGQNW